MGMDLWRKGVPSIGETFPRRFTHKRSTGGIGTGIYNFRTESAAIRNANDQRFRSGDEVYRLENAVERPIQPQTEEATRILNYFSRKLALIVWSVHTDQVTWERVEERGSHLSLTLTGGLGGSPRVDDGSDWLGADLITLLGDTPELREKYSYDSDALVEDGIAAAKETYRALDGRWHVHEPQPLNLLLYPDFDGVCPYEDAGGDSGAWGCVILLERIQECVPGDYSYNDRIDAETLNACWGGSV